MTEAAPVVAETLPNGLTVLLRTDRSAPLVSCWTWYRVGSRNELPGRTGVSHWVEHMQFKGTEKLEKGQIFREVSRCGGVLNALTSSDWTAYFETLPSSRFDLALDIESDRMANSIFDPAETESERTVILSERQGSENNPGYLLYEEVVGAAFRAHPYRHMVIGHEADLRAISRDDLYDHYRRFYQPNNAFVVAVGDFDPDDALDRIGARFGAIPSGAPIDASVAAEPPQRAERRIVLRRPSPTAYVRMAYHTPAAKHPDTAALLVADAVLSGGKGMGFGGGGAMGRSSRFYRALVEGRLARAAGTDFGLSLDPSLFMVGVTGLEGVEPAAMEDVVDRELQRLRDEPVPADELERAKKQVRAQYVYSAEGVTNQAFWLGQMEIVDTYVRAGSILGELLAVTADDIQRVANEYLRPDHRTVGWLVPDGAGNGATAGAPTASAAVAPRAWGLSGPVGAAAPPAHLPFERAELDNGLVVLGQARPGDPSVAVRFRIAAGAIEEPGRQAGLASMTARLLTRGSADRTFAEINERTDSLGAAIGSDAGRHAAEFSVKCLAEDLPEMLALAAELIRTPAFPAAELDTVRGQVLTALAEADNDTRASADRAMRSTLYGPDHALGRRVAGEPETVAALSRDDLQAFHGQHFAPNETMVALVGGIGSFPAAVDAVARIVGDWDTRAVAHVEPPPVPAAASAREEVAIPGKSQADVAIGLATIPRLDPDYYALDVANLILGRLGLMGRLGSNVRDRQGLAYYVFSSIEPGKEGSLWVSRAGVDPANVERAIDGVAQELARLGTEPVDADELDDAKSYLTGILPLALESNDGVAATLLTIEYYDLGLDFIERYPAIVEAITRDDVRAAAGRYLSPGRTTIGIARPA